MKHKTKPKPAEHYKNYVINPKKKPEKAHWNEKEPNVVEKES